MKKFLRFLIKILIILIVGFTVFFLNKKSPKKSNEYTELQEYISVIYGKTFLIPEFTDINQADESWLWENVNQYLWKNDDIYHEKNSQSYGYTYGEISKIVNILYGDNLKKTFPTGTVAMRYFSYNDRYGPTSYSVESYYDYKIDKITQNSNTYTVSLYDFTVSSYRMLGNNPDGFFDIYNNYEFLLNGDNGTPIISVATLKDSKFNNVLNYKDKLSHKVLTIEYDEKTDQYHITSCKYLDTKPEEILATYYNKMQNTFETYYIDYVYEDIYTQDEIIVNNFDELTSIYTSNSVDTYKDEMDLFVYKDNGDVYITAGDITVGDYISNVKFENIKETENEISASAIRTFRKSFDPSDKQYNDTYTVTDTFSIIKENDNTWKIDEFHYNNLK